MKVTVFNNINLNAINDKQWNSFCAYIEPYIVAFTKYDVNTAFVSVDKSGEIVKIQFDIKEREGLRTLHAKFDKFMCVSWVYKDSNAKYNKKPPSVVTLSWQVFLTKIFGDMYKFDLDEFYKKNKINTKLINTLIKNSKNDFEI